MLTNICYFDTFFVLTLANICYFATFFVLTLANVCHFTTSFACSVGADIIRPFFACIFGFLQKIQNANHNMQQRRMHRCGKIRTYQNKNITSLAALVCNKFCKTENNCLHGVLGLAPSGSGSGRYRTPGGFGSFVAQKNTCK